MFKRISPSGKRRHLLGNQSVRKRISRKARTQKSPTLVRSQKNPVRVVFVCYYGENSRREMDKLTKFLQQTSTGYVTVNFVPIMDSNTHKIRSGPQIKRELKNADVIVTPFMPPGEGIQKIMEKSPLIRRVQGAYPKNSLVLPAINLTPEQSWVLLRYIRQRFKVI